MPTERVYGDPSAWGRAVAHLDMDAFYVSVERGALLLAFYSLGLAIPFLLTALAFTRMTTAFSFVKRHYAAIMAFGGVVLVVMGVLVFTGELTRLNVEIQQWLNDLGINFFNEV